MNGDTRNYRPAIFVVYRLLTNMIHFLIKFNRIIIKIIMNLKRAITEYYIKDKALLIMGTYKIALLRTI